MRCDSMRCNVCICMLQYGHIKYALKRLKFENSNHIHHSKWMSEDAQIFQVRSFQLNRYILFYFVLQMQFTRMARREAKWRRSALCLSFVESIDKSWCIAYEPQLVQSTKLNCSAAAAVVPSLVLVSVLSSTSSVFRRVKLSLLRAEKQRSNNWTVDLRRCEY